MKANELRIGNLVFEHYGGIYEVLMVSPNYLDLVKTYASISGRYDIESIQPIPLTEEWLVKFGFRKTFDSPFEDFEWTDNNLQLSEKFDCYLGKFTQPIQYVHQLQNLYFALTGEELELKQNVV